MSALPASSPTLAPLRIVIVGGGVSGSLVAMHLLRTAERPLEVVLLERHPPIARGVAYGTWADEHLLNVPAARMGADPDDVGGFLRWATERAGAQRLPAPVQPYDFLPRRLYGEYVYSLLVAARAAARPGVTLKIADEEAVDAWEMPDGKRVSLRSGRTLTTDRVVLALGNLPGEYPLRRSLPFYHTRYYAHVPWADDALTGIPAEAGVLVVGMGLSAIDTLLSLARAGHRGPIYSVSRRGWRPHVHASAPLPVYPAFLDPATAPRTILGLWRAVRAEIRQAAAAGQDWRAVLDALRPVTAQLWQGLDWAERARFMRHVRPVWEAHRHRLAPAVHARIEALRTRGTVMFFDGRIESLTAGPTDAEVWVRRRGSSSRIALRVARVINCTGPRSDYSKYQHPLLINLLARGLIDHDPLALGIEATPAGEVKRYRGEPSGWLFTLGAPLKGGLWECSAIPEIRVQARALAALLLTRHPPGPAA